MSATSPAEPVGEAKTSAAIQAGDLAVTGFSGTTLVTDKLPPGVDPVDRTFIDPNGPALRIFDVSSLAGAPAGKLVDAPLRLDVPASQIGQVFGLTFDAGTADAPPNLYVAATSAFGLNIVGAGQAADGKPVRLKAGAPDAVFMEGQFGSLGSNSPSAIYRIDGATGAPSYFADTAFTGKSNAGPGIGALAFDSASRTLYASDLDAGLIHRFGLDYNAADLSQFDHGVAGRRAKGLEPIADDGRRLEITDPSFKPEDPATWGITQPERRVDAMAVRDDRLYYSVAAGPEIWSVGLRGGDFGDDARLEVKVKAQNPYPVTSIAFDGNGRMLLAQRGPMMSPYDYGSFASAGGEVLRYAPKPANDAQPDERWQPEPASYAVGTADDGRGSDGGLSLQYAYKPDGTLDTGVCDASVVMSGDALTPKTNGVQINGIDLVRPANVPPTQSSFIGYDKSDDDPAVRGHVGNVAALRNCGPDSVFPPVQEAGAEGMPPVEGGGEGMPPVEGGGQGMPPVEDGGGVTMPPVEETPGEPEFPETQTETEGGGETAEVDGVSITKSAAPGTCTEQGGCTFNIDITNNSGKDLPELVVGDELTAGAANLGGAKIEGAPPAPWTCTAPPKFTCKHPGPVANGETVSLPMSFAPAGIGQEKELKNCATLGAAPVEIPKANGSESNGLKVEAKAISGSCGPGVPCEWEIIATNTGAVALSGELELRQGNIIRSAGKNVQPATLQLVTPPASPGTTCKVDDNQKIVFCNNPQTTIAPGASQSFKFTVKTDVPPGVPIDFFQSDVLVSIGKFSGTKDDPPKITSATAVAFMPLTPAAGEGAAAAAAPVGPVCATLPVEQPEQAEEPKPSEAGQISLLKTGVSCKNKKSCEFSFAIKNTSANDFDGEVVFDDSLTADAGIFGGTTINPAPPAPWSCPPNAQQGFKCTAKLKIPANSAAPPLNLTFELPGGIGAVQTVENCATLKDAPGPSCAKLPLEAPVDPQQQQGPQGPLVVEKQAMVTSCSALGGGCLFKVTVKNPGPGDFNGDIEFNDEATFLDQKLKVALNSSLPSGCKSDGQGSIQCKIPGPLKAGAPPLEFTFDMVPEQTTNAGSIRNCVTLAGTTNKVCAEIPLRKDKKPLLRAKKKLESGDCRPECTFVISVQNVGEGEFDGHLAFFDTPLKPGPVKLSPFVPINAEITVVGAQTGVTCPKGANPVCSFTGKIPPNGSVGATFKMIAIDKTFKGLNCAQVAGTAEDNVDNDQVRQRCVEISRDGKGETPFPNLAIEKRNASPDKGGVDHCDLKKECLFIIRVTNTGTGDFAGPIKVTDTISLGVPEVIERGPGGSAIWECTTAKNGPGGIATNTSIACEIPGLPNPAKPGTFGPLPPGRFIEVAISVKPGSTWQNSNTIRNCAELVANDGQDLGPLTANKKSCVSQRLDPFKLSIEKTGDQSCQTGGECKFDLNIFNNEQIVHDDPVTVVDNLTGLSSAEIVSITPVGDAQPFPCKPQPTKVPFNCTGHMKLEPGDKNHYTIVVRLPADASARSFTNCATVGDGAADVPRSERGGAESAKSCHTVTTAPSTSPQTTPPPKEPKCRGGMILLPEGECACPPGTNWNGRNCSPGEGGASGVNLGDECPADRPNGVFPHCCPSGTRFVDGVCRRDVVEPPPPQCPRSRPIGKYPNCCERGTHFDDGVCKRDKIVDPTRPPPECPRSRPIGKYPNCCERGTHFDDGVCKRDKIVDPTRPPPECPRSRPIGKYPNCCERGTHFDDGVCKRDSKGDGGTNPSKSDGETKPPPQCPRSRPIGKYPNCCERGTHFENGVCKRDGKGDGGTNPSKSDGETKPPPQCPRSRPIGTFPNCCERGTHFENGVCKRDGCPQGMTGKPPNCCPPGSRFQDGKCVKPKPAGEPCPKGSFGTKPNCTCPSGERWTGARCVRDTPTPSKTEPSKGKCTGGRVGTPPNCLCPPPMKFIGRRCRLIPKETPKPTPTGPSPKKQCSGGKVPRSGDGACVCPSGTTESGGQCVGAVR